MEAKNSIMGIYLLLLFVLVGDLSAEQVGLRIRLEDTKMSWLVMNEEFEDAMGKVVHYMQNGSGKYRHKELPIPVKFTRPVFDQAEPKE